MSEKTGKLDFRVDGETYQTWYKIVGDISSGVRPVVVLHGGPDLSHHYMLPFTDLHTRFNLPVIFYDQIGIGESSHPKDVPKEFWTVDLWMNELDNVINQLGVKDDFDLCGHSWGAMLAAHYVSHRHPPGLHRLVLASGSPSILLWVESVCRLLAKLPSELRGVLETHEKEGTTNDPEYQQGIKIFYAKHACQIDPWPVELLASFGALQADPTVSLTMLGPSTFTITGKLKDWTCLDQIHTITNPTLLTNGVDDEAQDVHMTFFEERDRYFKIVGEFLTEA